MKDKKKSIFAEGHVPDKLMGPIHALALQMFARGIINIVVTKNDKVGTNKLQNEHFAVIMTFREDNKGALVPSYTIPSIWKGFNFV